MLLLMRVTIALIDYITSNLIILCVFLLLDFQNKVVWITGASSGIGEYLAYSLAKRHAKLALSGVNIERLENVKKHCIGKLEV